MWTQYQRKGLAEMRPYVSGEDMSGVSISGVDSVSGPEVGGMVARNPENHADQWYVAADYFARNFEPVSSDTDFLDRLRAANLSRLPRYGHGTINQVGAWGAMQWGCALAGETGELCNVLKKYDRQMPTDPSPDELRTEIMYEIADVAIYLDLTAAYFGYDLRRAIETKFNRTSMKFGFPERL